MKKLMSLILVFVFLFGSTSALAASKSCEESACKNIPSSTCSNNFQFLAQSCGSKVSKMLQSLLNNLMCKYSNPECSKCCCMGCNDISCDCTGINCDASSCDCSCTDYETTLCDCLCGDCDSISGDCSGDDCDINSCDCSCKGCGKNSNIISNILGYYNPNLSNCQNNQSSNDSTGSSGSSDVDSTVPPTNDTGESSSNCQSSPSNPGNSTPSTPSVGDEPDTSTGNPSQPNNDGNSSNQDLSNSVLSYAQEVVNLVNKERTSRGLTALRVNENVQKAAQVRAQEQKSYFSHTRPNGTSCFTALTEFGVSYHGAGENIAMGQTSPQQVMNGWMNSSGHRANILNSKYTDIGVGCYKDANGRYYWAQMFIY